MNLLLRLVLLLAGLVFGASVAVVGALVFALWGLRSAWARLTGQRVTPFVLRMRPFGGFEPMARRTPSDSRTPRADSIGGRRGDVTDVEAKPPLG